METWSGTTCGTSHVAIASVKGGVDGGSWKLAEGTVKGTVEGGGRGGGWRVRRRAEGAV